MPRGENRASLLLSREENDQVFSLIGPKCQSLATAVVQLFTTEDPSHSRWKKKDTGVLCLVKDNGKRSYFFRIYCLYRKAMIWEQEVYLQIEYKNPRPFLHTFEAEEYMAAFNFANENEANILRNILLEKIELRKIRREERRQRSMVPRQNGTLPPPPPEPEPTPPPTPAPAPAPVLQPLPPKTNNSLGTYTLKSNKKQKARKLTKADIGMPQNFKHVSHVGWDVNKGFDLENAPIADELRSFFTKAGVSETQLQDQETRAFIYDFIEMNGGLPAVKQDLDNVSKIVSRGAVPPAPSMCAPAPPAPPAPAPAPAPAPPVPTRSPAPPHPPAPSHPPAPPSRPPPPPPTRIIPPPPAHRTAPPRPAQPVSGGPPSVPPPPPPGAAPAPPGIAPPPPAMPPAAPPPPPPPAPPAPPPMAPEAPPPPDFDTAPASADPRAALMESIRTGGKSLRRVEPVAKPAVVDDSRSNLLSEIRQGIELRSVSAPVAGGAGGAGGAGSGRRGAGPACGLAEALQRALEERSRAIHSSDSEMSDATTSDGEWDD